MSNKILKNDGIWNAQKSFVPIISVFNLKMASSGDRVKAINSLNNLGRFKQIVVLKCIAMKISNEAWSCLIYFHEDKYISSLTLYRKKWYFFFRKTILINWHVLFISFIIVPVYDILHLKQPCILIDINCNFFWKMKYKCIWPKKKYF